MELKNILNGETLELQWFIDTLKDILDKIFGFIAKEEGWEEKK